MIQVPASYYNYNHHLPFGWPQVQRLEGQGNYTVFVLFDGSHHISTKSLGNYEPFLPSSFVRIHKGHVVNLSAIISIYKTRRSIELSDGFCCEVARRRWKYLTSLLKSRKP
jgi:DNA-binding LytR/AlgR family response regulator